MNHIADIDYKAFFAPAFSTPVSAATFVSCVEGMRASTSRAKVVLHQAARMTWLSDRMGDFAHGRPALQILFLVIAAEAIAKLTVQFSGEGESKKHVRLFFESTCPQRCRNILAQAFRRPVGRSFLTIREAVDLLYDVRCDVVHEARYFNFSLRRSSDASEMLTSNAGTNVIAELSIEQLRQIVLEGAVVAACRLLPTDSECLSQAPDYARGSSGEQAV